MPAACPEDPVPVLDEPPLQTLAQSVATQVTLESRTHRGQGTREGDEQTERTITGPVEFEKRGQISVLHEFEPVFDGDGVHRAGVQKRTGTPPPAELAHPAI